MTITKDEYTISTNKDILNIPYIHAFLTTSYWAEGIPVDTVQRSIAGSLCFGVYKGEQQVGFARVISDEATFAYLADVFIDETERGKGLSKWLVEVILQYPTLQGIRRFELRTRDAHGLYAQFGFTPLTNPEIYMLIRFPDVYKQL
ncbi:GNAT family N-acetyltransferase [Pseudoflavitalea sp. X16]|uniref:GNAT family N-acetyltransferase n=1 Tax=Paraflavitalea devenefica TaxID=2716334 RepID=UPI00141E4B20|nr:GNAT family N-acetyltransferase [Paraflavitalea devenefica]NII24034.1 GNAT family N-acetyltransferase [Paraflavitalea devenefica]